MRKKKTIYIPDNEINNFNQDTFGHKYIAEAIVESVINTNSPFAIGIFGGWGTGKTSLIKLIDNELKDRKFTTVTIDAWRYSSSENLRRTFLVHVARKIAPNLLDNLRQRLYTSEQEEKTKPPSKLENPKSLLKDKIWPSVKNFLISLGILFFILCLIFSLKIILMNRGFSEFFSTFLSELEDIFDRLIELIFVPFLLMFIDYFHINVIQRPVTVFQERIDADELFSEYFEKVVNDAIHCKLHQKKIVIFIDNLDRLTDEKMVEALESLKTYLDNEHCIFIVACDENVVRSIINKSNPIPRVEDQQQLKFQAGEHYLDKFFQQTFRLPEYMPIDLSDFAAKNFENVKLFDELSSNGEDIRNLISIILPSDINSPRKVKRLLNEFISLYKIVQKREDVKNGQIRPGLLTSNIEFLGKFSTIRAEYPDFYLDLINSTELLSQLTGLLSEKGVEETLDIKNNERKRYSRSCIEYLNKTKAIMVDDLNPYIWLSQDNLALGLQANHNTLLRKALANGDFNQVRNLIDESEDIDYKNRIIEVSSRFVEQRLKGIDQKNGIKVLAALLPIIDDSMKPEIANVVARLFPLWKEKFLSVEEVFNILRWAQKGGINKQRERLLSEIISELQNQENRKLTFKSILDNSDVVEENKATSLVINWLEDILSLENQQILLPEENVEADKIDNGQNQINQDFSEWLISIVNDYSDNTLVIENYFAKALIDHIINIIGEKIENKESIYLDDEEGLGHDIKIVLDIISSQIKNGMLSSNYWNGLLSIIRESYYIPELEYSLNKILDLVENTPDAFSEPFLINIFKKLHFLLEKSETESDFPDILKLIDKTERVISELRKHIGKPFDIQESDKIITHISFLLGDQRICENFTVFLNSFFTEFGKDDSLVFISSEVDAFSKFGGDQAIGNLLLDFLIRWDNFVPTSRRNVVVDTINSLFITKEISLVENSSQYILKILELERYRELISKYLDSWIKDLGTVEIQVLIKKVDIHLVLINKGILDANDWINSIIPHIPFAGDQSKLQKILESIGSVRDQVQDEVGINLSKQVLDKIESFGELKLLGLNLVTLWINKLEEDHRSVFSQKIFGLYTNKPKEVFEILGKSWSSLNTSEIKKHIINFYTIEIDPSIQIDRDKSVAKGLEVISEQDRANFIIDVRNELNNIGIDASQFVKSVKEFIPLNILLDLRNNAMNEIRESGASPTSELNLKLLSVTIRDDVRKIMPVVNLFENLFGRSQNDIDLALKYCVDCLMPFNLTKDHKYKLAEAMKGAAIRSGSDKTKKIILAKAKELGLKWFKIDE